MKRPAEVQLEGESRSGTGGQPASVAANPFAGFSLSADATPAQSLFSAPAPSSSVNPFAGISLFGDAPPSSSLFSAAAASNATGGGFGGGFGSAPTAGFGFSASSGAPASAVTASDAKSSSNPFIGLSMFSASSGASTETTAGATSAGSNPFSGLSLFSSAPSGGVFTAAAESLQQGKGETTANAFAASATSVAEVSGKGELAEPQQAPAAVGAQGVSAETATTIAGSAASEIISDATGEEDEEMVFHGECKLWKLGRAGESTASPALASSENSTDGDTKKDWQWQERGCGIVHINRHRKTGKGRLVMRMRGVLKLLLNTPIFPTAKYELVGQKSVRFLGVDVDDVCSSDGQVNMCAFRLNLQSNEQQTKFLKVMRDGLGVTTPT